MSPTTCIESESAVNPALIMIPDISGFTEYMNDADLSHSQLRIASLIEAILENNVLKLNVSEIEGDAILFFSFNNTSTAEEILEQCQLTFNKFHEKLKEFETLECQCGSCQRLQNLSLKFVLHYGQLGSVMVKDYCKLYGRELIVAHRLLKNNIPTREYIAFTSDFALHYNLTDNINQISLSGWVVEQQYIPNIGNVEFNYVELNVNVAT